MRGDRETERQRNRETVMQKYRDTEYRDTEYRDTEYRDTEIEVRKQRGKRGKNHVPGFDCR